LTGGSLGAFAHRASWALPRSNPLPEDYRTLDQWGRAIDCVVSPTRRLEPGALEILCRPGETVAAAFGRRLADTPGVVISQEPQFHVPIKISSVRVTLPAEAEGHFRHLRNKWETPDQEAVPDGASMWRHARELATGFYSVWDPRGPSDWRDARRAWHSVCRDTLSSNGRELYTEEQLTLFLRVARDVSCSTCGAAKGAPCVPGRTCPDRTHYPEAARILEAWREIEPSFRPNPVARWISDSTLDLIVAWARERPGLIWTDRPALGMRLAARGLPYYGGEGIDAKTGRYVEAHRSAEGSIVLSRQANQSGRNLQHEWSRNLIVDVPPGGKEWEQLIGRTHRPGQLARRVDIDVLFGCVEDVKAFWDAHEKSLRMAEISTQPQKLLWADLTEVTSMEEAADWSEDGPQWKKTRPPERDLDGDA
jgi:hypothetical protein